MWKGVFGVWREVLKGKGTGVAFVRAARAFSGELFLCSDDCSVRKECWWFWVMRIIFWIYPVTWRRRE